MSTSILGHFDARGIPRPQSPSNFVLTALLPQPIALRLCFLCFWCAVVEWVNLKQLWLLLGEKS